MHMIIILMSTNYMNFIKANKGYSVVKFPLQHEYFTKNNNTQ